MQSGHCIDAVIRSGISKFYTAPLAKHATLIIKILSPNPRLVNFIP